MELVAGDRIDRFVLLDPLGEGGQGAVWKAEDPLAPGVPRALKLVPVNPARPNDVERARREARALARLDHPSLVECHGMFEDLRRGVLGVVMDFVDGTSLRSAEQDARFTQVHRTEVLRHVARVLAYLHESGVVHRDLKLDNVLVKSSFFEAPSDPTNVKVVDLGIAAVRDAPGKLTALGTVVGTVPYLAPELLDPATFSADESSTAIDVFAFGVLGWQLLTGVHPTGLPNTATLVDYVRAYREAADQKAWPPAPPAGEWGSLLVDALRARQAERISSGKELAERAGAAPITGVVVRPRPAPGMPIESAPTSVASPGAMRDPTVASLQHAPTAPIGPVAAVASGHTLAWLWAGLGGVAVIGLVAWFFMATRGKPVPSPAPGPSTPTPITSNVARPLADATADAGADVVSTGDAGLLGFPDGCSETTGTCDCCPSGHGCEPGRCTDPLEPDEGWHLRLAEIPKNGDKLLSETHPNAEVCVKLIDVASWKCTPVSELTDGGAPAGYLYIPTLGLTTTGFDLLVQFALPGSSVKAPIATAERITLPGVARAHLCKGVEIEMQKTSVGIQRLRFYLDGDDTRLAAPPRKLCP